jgi:hypothetical protein
LVVCISNNELEILEYAKGKIGAGRITTKRTYNERHADSYAYQISSRQALDLLTQIVPHMKSYKARRALLTLKHYVRLTPRNGKYRPGVVKERERFEHQVLSIRPGKSRVSVSTPEGEHPRDDLVVCSSVASQNNNRGLQ